jgi:hypothetical protein
MALPGGKGGSKYRIHWLWSAGIINFTTIEPGNGAFSRKTELSIPAQQTLTKNANFTLFYAGFKVLSLSAEDLVSADHIGKYINDCV